MAGSSEPALLEPERATETDPARGGDVSEATVRNGLDETRLRRAFSGAPSTSQVLLEETLAVGRVGDRIEVIAQLQKLLRYPGLTPAQRAAVEEALARLQAPSR